VLLKAGASIDCTNDQGTALRAAARNDNEDIVKLLLQSGANPNIESLPTKGFIWHAWISYFGRRPGEMLKLLLSGGLKVGIKDWWDIYKASIKHIQQLEAALAEHHKLWTSQHLEEAKSFLELFEALPQWQAVKDTVLSN
jgi:hypothetical protein